MKIGIADMVSNFVPGSGNPLGMDTSTWHLFEPAQRLELVLDIISQSNFDYLELGVPWINGTNDHPSFDLVASIIKDRNLVVGSYCSMVPGNFKTVGIDIEWDTLKRYINMVFANCNKLGGNVIVYGSGASRTIPNNYSRSLAEQDMVSFLQLMSDVINENNYPFKIAIEPLNTRECNYINSLDEADRLVRKVGSSNIGIVVDIFHAYLQKNNFLDELSAVMENVIHIHVSQPEDRGWPGHLQQSGLFDFIEFFKTINSSNYKGNVTVECNFNNLKSEINTCKDFLDNVCFVH